MLKNKISKLLFKSPVARILNPFKFSLSFLRDYHFLVNQNTCALWKGSENILICSQIKTLLRLSSLRIGQFLLLYLAPALTNHTEVLQIVAFDLVHFLRLPAEYCLVFATFGLLSNYTLRLLFFDVTCLRLVNLMFPVLFHQNEAYFLQYSQNKEVKGGQRSPSQVIASKLRLYVRLFSPFSLIGASWILMTEATFFNVMFTVRKDRYPILLSAIYYLLAQASILLDYLAILLFLSVSLLNSAAFAALTMIIFARLDQINGLLNSVSPRSFNFFLFYRFSRFHARTLQDVFLSNAVCGQVLLLMVALFTPINAYMLMTLLLGRIQLPVLYPFIGAVFIGQFTVLFCFHYGTTWYGRKIHSHAKRLLHLSVNSRRGEDDKAFSSKLHSFHAKLKVHNYIEKFLTKKLYGIEYGGPRRGLCTVSMNSLAKVDNFLFLINYSFLTF